jgi:hypothetical protein
VLLRLEQDTGVLNIVCYQLCRECKGAANAQTAII